MCCLGYWFKGLTGSDSNECSTLKNEQSPTHIIFHSRSILQHKDTPFHSEVYNYMEYNVHKVPPSQILASFLNGIHLISVYILSDELYFFCAKLLILSVLYNPSIIPIKINMRTCGKTAQLNERSVRQENTDHDFNILWINFKHTVHTVRQVHILKNLRAWPQTIQEIAGNQTAVQK